MVSNNNEKYTIEKFLKSEKRRKALLYFIISLILSIISTSFTVFTIIASKKVYINIKSSIFKYEYIRVVLVFIILLSLLIFIIKMIIKIIKKRQDKKAEIFNYVKEREKEIFININQAISNSIKYGERL